MARYIDPKCRLCRREGVKLFLKGKRCLGTKCPVERKGAVHPGMIGRKSRRGGRMSEYGVQLREKQKAKRIYGVLERQFAKYFKKARKVKGATGEALLEILELRLDNVLYRLALAPSRSVSRQIVSHGHTLVNGKKVNIPSYQVKVDDALSLTSKGMGILEVKEILAQKNVIIPSWLERKGPVGHVKRLPTREEIGGDISEQLIVEYYSR